MLIDVESLRKLCASAKDSEVSLDYFLYHAMNYEACLGVANSKKFVPTPSWHSNSELTSSDTTSLTTLTDWYAHNFPQLHQRHKLTYILLYSYLPPFLNYMEEAKQLWQQQHGQPPIEFAPSAPFWNELTTCIKEKFNHPHLLIPYLHWRYGEPPKTSIPLKHMPPNPYAFEKRFRKSPPKRSTPFKRRQR